MRISGGAQRLLLDRSKNRRPKLYRGNLCKDQLSGVIKGKLPHTIPCKKIAECCLLWVACLAGGVFHKVSNRQSLNKMVCLPGPFPHPLTPPPPPHWILTWCSLVTLLSVKYLLGDDSVLILSFPHVFHFSVRVLVVFWSLSCHECMLSFSVVRSASFSSFVCW